MALDYRLFFETDLSPDELVDLITNKKAVAREPLACGIAFQFDGIPCAFVTEDAEDRSFTLKEYGFSPTVHLAARLDKTRPERDLALFKRLVATVLLAFDGDVVLTFDDGGVVLRRRGGVGTVEPGWSEQFGDLLPLLGEGMSGAALAREALDFCLHLATGLSPTELVDMIAKVGMQERQPLAHFAKEFSATERADLKTGSGVTERGPTTRGTFFRFDGVRCLLEKKDEEDRNAAMATFGFTPTVHLHMHLDPEQRRIQLAVIKHIIVTVLDTLQFDDAVLVAFTENPVVLFRRGRVGVIEPDWSHVFGDLAPLLGERWSVGASSSIGHQPRTGEPLTAETPFYYFGVLDFNALIRQPGHRLYRVAPQPAPGEQVQLPWKEMELDAALCPGFRSGGTPSDYQVEGLARIHHRDGWTALAFWDRSMDVRPGSNSVFIAQGEYDFAGMKALAQRRCPKVWGRWFFEFRQEDTSAQSSVATQPTMALEYRLYLAAGPPPDVLADMIIGNAVVGIGQLTNGVAFELDGVRCVLSTEEAEEHGRVKEMYGISPTVQLRMHLQAGDRQINHPLLPQLRIVLKRIVVTVLRAVGGHAVLVAFNDESVVLRRRAGIGMIERNKMHEFGDLLPLLGNGWSVAEPPE